METDRLVLSAVPDYITNGAKTKTGRQRISERFLRREIEAGNLRAAQIGGRKQYYTTRQWVDSYLEDRARPVMVVPVRKRA